MPTVTDILTELGVPAGAILIAAGLVWGARFFEEDASDSALRYIAGLLTAGRVANAAKIGATAVPLIFDRIFGPRPLSLKFILRSLLATTIFWLVLLVFKHPDWEYVLGRIIDKWPMYLIAIPLWFLLDWVSLSKARILLNVVVNRYALSSSLLFFIMDLVVSFVLAFISFQLLAFVYVSITVGYPYFKYQDVVKDLSEYASLHPILAWYLFKPGQSIDLLDVITPSTLLTSLWTLFVFCAGIVTLTFVPIDHLRRFTAWWFRDLEHHPLTAIAKVGATLVIVGAIVLKAARWVFA